MTEKNENWFQRNWYIIVVKGALYLGILSLLTFVVSLALYWAFGYETMLGIKISVVLYIISACIGALKGLR
jgi:hypothetical protein